ncbi:MAG: DUF4019 domain-containing protein [Pseudomonadota bacterium]
MFRLLSRVSIAIASTALACQTSQTSAPTDSNALAAATTAAQSWLALVDQEKYDESWNAAATIFKSAVTEATWQDDMSRAREPLGKLATRQLKSAEFETTLPGAPDGEYVVIQFSSSFENNPAAVETVTPTRESDGTWRVSGYFIK